MSRIAPYPLRLTPEMRGFIEKEAEKSKRSLQQEILYRLDKFQQIERLISSSASDSEDVYMQIASALRTSKSVEDKVREIESLKSRINELLAAMKVSETDRFIAISKNADVIERAINNIVSALPPIPEPIKKPT